MLFSTSGSFSALAVSNSLASSVGSPNSSSVSRRSATVRRSPRTLKRRSLRIEKANRTGKHAVAIIRAPRPGYATTPLECRDGRRDRVRRLPATAGRVAYWLLLAPKTAAANMLNAYLRERRLILDTGTLPSHLGLNSVTPAAVSPLSTVNQSVVKPWQLGKAQQCHFLQLTHREPPRERRVRVM